MKADYKGFWSVGRLIIGIVLMVLAMIVLFQSCATGVVNTLEENTEDAGGSAGLFVTVLMIVSGIVAICTRNSKSKAGAFVTAGLLALAALLTFFNAAVFTDLIVWGVVCIAFAIVFAVCGIKTKKQEVENQGTER